MLDSVVALCQQQCDEMALNSDGVFSKITFKRSGVDLVIDMYIAIPQFKFSELPASYKETFAEELEKSFIEGMFSDGKDTNEILKVLKRIGTKIYLNVYDPSLDKISRVIDFRNR